MAIVYTSESQQELDPRRIREERYRAGLTRIRSGTERIRAAREGMRVVREAAAGHIAVDTLNGSNNAGIRFPESTWAHRLNWGAAKEEATPEEQLTETERIAADFDAMVKQVRPDTAVRQPDLPTDPITAARRMVSEARFFADEKQDPRSTNDGGFAKAA